MKKIYIIPELAIAKMSVENMIALSGPQTSNTSADQSAGMEVKAGQTESYNVWDDDWSK